MRFGRLKRGDAFDHLEAVGRDEKCLGRRVIAVVGAADALDQAFDVLRGADLDHKVHIAPVDPQIEAAGANHGAKLPLGHRLFHRVPLFTRKAAVVNADGQIARVGKPEVVEKDFRLRAGVVKDQSRPVAFHLFENLFNRIAPATA